MFSHVQNTVFVRTSSAPPSTSRGPVQHQTLRLASLLLLACACACAPPSRPVGLGPLVTDRPDFTESALTVPAGLVQVEAGATASREEGVRTLSTGETLVRAGISRRVELRVTAASYAVERSAVARAQGLEDTGLGVKIALRDGSPAPSLLGPTLALIAGTSLPTGADAFRSRRALPEAKLLAAWSITDRVGFASNANWARAEDAGAAHDEWSGSGSIAVALTERVGGYAEYFAFGERMADWRRREYVNGGITYLLRDDLQLDVRAGVRVRDAREGAFFGFGFSRRY